MATIDAVPVDPSNADARRAWDGADGDYWAANERIFERSLEGYRSRFTEAAAIAAGDTVLDVGCGTGATTRDAARAAGHGSALGVDLSSAMLDVARRRAGEEGLTNVRFVQADAQVHPFSPAAFDVAISRTGTMFFGDPVAAFANIGRALRSGGRLTLLVWQPPERNPWFLAVSTSLAAGRQLPGPAPDGPGPFSLADPGKVRSVLEAAGFTAVACAGVEAPMYFGDNADEAERFLRGLGFSQFLLEGLDDAARAGALAALRASIEAHETAADGVRYPSAVWIVTASRP